MTMSVNVANRGPTAYVAKVIVEDFRKGGHAQIDPDTWVEVDSFELRAGEHRDITVWDTRRVRVEEAKVG